MSELVAPIIPSGQDNKAPFILMEGLGRGLAAFAQMSSIRRQQESDMARMALEERLAQERHAVEGRKLDQAAQLIPAQIAAHEAETDLRTEQASAYAEGTATSAQMKAEATKQKNLLLKEVADNAREMKLDDVHFQTKEPMRFAKNVMEFGRMYHLSPLPEVRRAIKSYQSVADSQKLFIKHGVDEDGVIKGTGNGRQVPAWRIISNINNPDTKDQTMRDLEASGYMDIVNGFKQVQKEPTFFQKLRGAPGDKVSEPTVKKVLRQPVQRMLDEAQTLEADPTAAPVEAAPAPEPDYGPDTETPQYPVGTRGKRGGSWYVLTEEGWKPE